jgi:hypothetical protein
MGIFGKVVLGGLAFLAGAAFMANEQEQERHHEPWKRKYPSKEPEASSAVSQQQTPIHPPYQQGPTIPQPKQGVIKDLIHETIDKLAPHQSQSTPTPNEGFENPPGKPLFQFPIYGKGPLMNTQGSKGFESPKKIGTLEVYRDSIKNLIDMPEFKDLHLDMETIKRFFENDYIQAFLRARMDCAANKFRPDCEGNQTPHQPSSGSSSGDTPATGTTAATDKQAEADPTVAESKKSDAPANEYRSNSVVGISSFKGWDDPVPPLKSDDQPK